jgi:hypothetical protein
VHDSPLRRSVTATEHAVHDIRISARFLCSPEARFITGANLMSTARESLR